MSYLTNRKQVVLSKNCETSSWKDINSGVPQGSIFGPILFLIYIDDIRFNIKYSKWLVYADDLQIYMKTTIEDVSDDISKLECDISCVTSWANNNLLLLNQDKTQAIAFGNRDDLEILYNNNNLIKINDKIITLQHSVNNLGVIFNSSLSWTDHIKRIEKKLILLFINFDTSVTYG